MVAYRGRGLADYATIAESIALALAIELALKLMPFSRLLTLLDRLEPTSLRALSHGIPYSRLERFATAAYGLLPMGSTCLRRSLVLYSLLRRRGALPKLCLGVRRDRPALSAHAWIECVGLAPADGIASFHELRPSRS